MEGFSSCEKAYESVPCANKGLCPFETCKPLKRLDLNFLTSHSGRFFTHAGVLAVFKPRRGRLKIPVAPTGKLKLHVFPLRRAKENKHFGSFSDILQCTQNGFSQSIAQREKCCKQEEKLFLSYNHIKIIQVTNSAFFRGVNSAIVQVLLLLTSFYWCDILKI